MLPKKLGEREILGALFNEEEEAIEMSSTSTSEGRVQFFCSEFWCWFSVD
jgi:hypothetical protein